MARRYPSKRQRVPGGERNGSPDIGRYCAAAAGIAKIPLFVFLVVFVVTLVAGSVGRRTV